MIGMNFHLSSTLTGRMANIYLLMLIRVFGIFIHFTGIKSVHNKFSSDKYWLVAKVDLLKDLICINFLHHYWCSYILLTFLHLAS